MAGALTKIHLDLFLKTSTSKKIRTAFKLKCQVFWKHATEQIVFGTGRIKNDWERSEIKEICKQQSSHCILAGFSLIPRLALNQAALRGSQGCRIITRSAVNPGETFHGLPQHSQPLLWGFPALFYSCLRLHQVFISSWLCPWEGAALCPVASSHPTAGPGKRGWSPLPSLSLVRDAAARKGAKQALAVRTAPCISPSSHSAGRFLQQNKITGLQDLVLKLTVLETGASVRRRSHISGTEGQRGWVPKGRTSKKKQDKSSTL